MSIRRFIQRLKSFFVETPSETPNQDESVSGAVRKDEPDVPPKDESESVPASAAPSKQANP